MSIMQKNKETAKKGENLTTYERGLMTVHAISSKTMKVSTNGNLKFK